MARLASDRWVVGQTTIRFGMTERPDAEDLQRFRAFVADSRWRFAKTYVESYPHEYTLRSWGDGHNFWEAILRIERCGVPERFLGTQRTYLYLDDRKYWHMGNASADNPDERPGLINRSWVDVTNYREHARALGYDEQNLDRLTARWRRLLERARRST
jgi:hypothetical protein